MEIDDELGRRLHDWSTRGQQLSTNEQMQLQAWYAKWDRIEMKQLGLTPEQIAAEEAELADLQALVEVEEAQAAALAESNWRLAQQNDALRAEIDALRRQAAERRAGLSVHPSHSPQPVG
jgi:hypothetical protein